MSKSRRTTRYAVYSFHEEYSSIHSYSTNIVFAWMLTDSKSTETRIPTLTRRWFPPVQWLGPNHFSASCGPSYCSGVAKNLRQGVRKIFLINGADFQGWRSRGNWISGTKMYVFSWQEVRTHPTHLVYPRQCPDGPSIPTLNVSNVHYYRLSLYIRQHSAAISRG